MKPDLLQMGPMYPPTQKVLDETYTLHKVWEAPDRDAFLASIADKITAAATTGSKGIDDATLGKYRDALASLVTALDGMIGQFGT